MLKVHPDNITAKHIYEKHGFKQTGIDPKIHHLIYHKDLSEYLNEDWFLYTSYYA